MADPIVIGFVVFALIIGELIFRRRPGAGGLAYNIIGTVGGVFWVLAGAFLIWGGSYLFGALLVIIGVNIHRSNYRISRKALSRKRLNG